MLHRTTDIHAALRARDVDARARSADQRRAHALTIGSARSAANRRFGGRGGGRRGGGGAAAPALQATAINGFVTSTNYYQTAAGVGPGGNVAGFTVAVVRRVDTANVSSILFSRQAGLGGWLLETSGTVYRIRAYDGVTTLIASPTVAESGVGMIDRIVGVYDAGASLLRLYVNGVQVGAGTAMTGYTPSLVGARTGLGSNGLGGVAASGSSIIGVVAANATIASPSDVATWDAAVVAAAECVSLPTGTTHRWQASDNPAAGATWTDDVGAVAVSRVGTLAATVFTPSWGT